MSYKYCFVPGCKSTTLKNPQKIFFLVPFKETERMKWIQVTRRDTTSSPLSPTSKTYCCEDHFDVETDMLNFRQYKMYTNLGYTTHAKLKPGVVPHKFDCQPTRLLTQRKPRHSVVEKLQRQAVVSEAFRTHSEETEEPPSEVIKETPGTSEITSSPLHSGGVGTSQAPDINADNSTFHCRDSGTSQTQEQNITAELPSASSKKEYKLLRNVSTQTAITCKSVGLQVNCRKRVLLLDSTTQVTPEKRLKQTPPESPELSSSSGTTSISAGGSLYVVSSSSATTSGTSITDEKSRGISLRKHIREATNFNIENNPKFYIGIPPESYRFLQKLESVTQCSIRDILLTLKKLRLNQPFIALGDDFGISSSRASRIFSTVIFTLAVEMESLIYWPQRDFISINAPVPFRRRYSKVVGIIDCFEVKIEKPSKPLDQALTWSDYKKSNTIKFLVAATPHGFITYISKGYCGRTTDTNLTKDCGFIDTIPGGGHVMADRGFKLLDRSLKNTKLVRPPSVRSGEKLSKELAKETKRIASLRINIERVIGRLRVFQFIAPGTVLDLKLAVTVNAAVKVVCALCNLHDPFFL